MLAFPATASAHENGWNTWSLYKDAHLNLEAPDIRGEALDATKAQAQRTYDRAVARLRSEWREFDAAYWKSLEPEPEPEPTIESNATDSSPIVPSGDIWSQLAMCESTMQNLPCAPYCGYFQFSESTWQALGYSLPVQAHSYGTQMAAAQQAVANWGWSQFPGCAAQMGML